MAEKIVALTQNLSSFASTEFGKPSIMYLGLRNSRPFASKWDAVLG